MTRERDFWPCLPIDDEHGKLQSITFTQFELLDRNYPRATTGYAVESLVKKLADAKLRKRVKFDPEADMFAAYGGDAAALLAVAKLIRTATGMRPPRAGATRTKLEPDRARELLARGFLAGLDEVAQRDFLAGWPRPANSNHDRLLKELAGRDAAKRLAAARQLLRAACRVIGRLENPLCHPTTFDAVIAALEREAESRIHDELVGALAMMVERAAPDLRTGPVFVHLLGHPRKRVRERAAAGLGELAQVPWDVIVPLFDDEQPQVRATALAIAARARGEKRAWITDDLALGHRELPREHLPRVVRMLDDPDPSVRSWAARVLSKAGAVELAGEIEKRIRREKVKAVRDSFRRDAAALRARG